MAQCQKEISSYEYTEWLAYYQIEPFGEERADLRSAILCTLVASVFASKGYKPKVSDFMPDFEKAVNRRSQSAEEIQAQLRMIYGDNRHNRNFRTG